MDAIKSLPYIVFIICSLLSALVAAISQTILKSAANVEYDKKYKEYLNVRVISAYGLFFLSFILGFIALFKVDFATNSIINASSYIFVGVLGYFVLKERINLWKALGLILIIIGIVVAVLNI